MSKPAVVIGKVEDSPDWLDRRLVEFYLRTDYLVLSAPFGGIRIRAANFLLEKWLSERGFETYAFITAWNPGSRMLSKRQNRRRNNQLEKELKKVSRLVLPGLGSGADGDWPPEESFLALDISAEEAVRLGRRFGQNAIVWWEKGGLPELWAVEGTPPV